MNKLTKEEKTEIIKIVLDSAQIIFETENGSQADLEIEVKGFGDYVTRVDQEIQNYIEKELLKIFPEHQFLGEEGERHSFDQTKPCWILDPIDGTTNLVWDIQHSAISLAFWNGLDLEFGAIYDPFLDELFVASRGEGAQLIQAAKRNYPKQVKIDLKMRELKKLSQAIVAFGSAPSGRGTDVDHKVVFEVLSDVFFATEDVRRFGSAALDLSYIAADRFQIFYEPKLSPWDFAAGILIVEEAGGVVTDFKGQAIDIFQPSSIVSANPVLHKKFLPLLERLT